MALTLAPIAGGSSAWADVRDVKVAAAGVRADILIEFDASPTAAAAGPEADRLTIYASGVSARPRRIETLSPGIIDALVVREGEGGVEIELHLARDAVSAQARLEGRVLRVTVSFAEPVPGPALASASAPASLAAHAADPAPSAPVPMTAPPPGVATLAAPQDPNAASLVAAVDPSALATTAPVPSAPDLRLGGGETARAAAPQPANAGGSGRPAAARDPSRPAVIFAGALTEEDCMTAETAIRTDPWDLAALKRYASCEALRGEAAGAETAFRRLLTFTPDDPEAELGLAVVRHEQGFAGEAAGAYQRLLEDATTDAGAARLRALLTLAAAGR
jgi:hypothetical protein